jgi:predicted PurR-regulated permease PerM
MPVLPGKFTIMELTISNRTIIRVVAIVAAMVLTVWLLFKLHTVVVWILTALFLALALEPAVAWLSRYLPKRSRALAVLVVLLVTGGVLAFVLVALIPPFAFQLFHLVTTLPEAYKQFSQQDPGVSGLINSSIGSANTNQALQQFSKELVNFGGSAVSVAGQVFGGIFAVVTVIILTYFMVLEGPGWVEAFWSYLPRSTREKYRGLLQRMQGTVTGYVSGNIVKSLIAVVASGIALIAVGSPFPFALALLVGILDLVPLVGATLAAISVCLVLLVFKGITTALIILVFFLIFQQLENYVFQPLIFSKTVEVSPLVTLLAIIIGTALAGFIGALVAIPAAASLQILLRFVLAGHKARNQKAA